MNENSRCQVYQKMMGRGADGGCGTEEKPCPVTKITPAAKTPAPAPTKSPENVESEILGVDLYSQAVKALSERSPFDSNEVVANKVATLPSGLASLLLKQSDSKKKHKRAHSETKSSRKGSVEKKSKSPSIWNALEDYFRELTLQDIERLYQFSSSFLNSSDKCFKIPVLGNAIRSSSSTIGNVSKVENGNDDYVPATEIKEEEVLDADVSMPDVAAVRDIEEEVGKENDKLRDAKIENGTKDSLGVVEEGPLPEYTLPSCSSIEWVLGSRNRVFLTTTRP